MPSVPELVRQYKVAPSTAQAAVETLRREGVVVRRRGSGTFVAERSAIAGNGAHPEYRPTPPHPGVKKGAFVILALYSVPFFRHFVDHITARAASQGLSVVCRYDDQKMALDDALTLEVLDPAGFLIVGWQLEWVAKELMGRGHRTVLFGEPPPDGFASVPTVYGNSEYAGYLATRRLLEMGHRRLLVAHGFATEEELFARRRWRGHLRALREAGIDPAHPNIGKPNAAGWQEDLDALRELFGGKNAPTGVMAWSDIDARGLMSALAQAGLRVPEDVSVVAYGNLPAALQTDPPLDTIDPHLDVQIEHAFSLLSAPAFAGAVPTAVVTPTLVARASCARPRVSI